MNSFFVAFHTIFAVGVASFGTMLSSFVPFHQIHSKVIPQIPTIRVTVIPTILPAITMHQTVHVMGKKVTIFLSLPKDGGAIKGGISGDCQGTVMGLYSGQPQYLLNGKGEITCTVGVLSLPANVLFMGMIYPEKHNVNIHYTIGGSGYTKSGDMTASYIE